MTIDSLIRLSLTRLYQIDSKQRHNDHFPTINWNIYEKSFSRHNFSSYSYDDFDCQSEEEHPETCGNKLARCIQSPTLKEEYDANFGTRIQWLSFKNIQSAQNSLE